MGNGEVNPDLQAPGDTAWVRGRGRLLREDAVFKLGKARVAAQRIEKRMHFDELQDVELLGGSAVESDENLLFVVQTGPGAELRWGSMALAEEPIPVQVSGLINDFSPSTVSGGPWEMHGASTLL